MNVHSVCERATTPARRAGCQPDVMEVSMARALNVSPLRLRKLHAPRHPSFKVKEPGARAERRRRFKEFESVSVGSACGHAQCVRADVFRHAPDTVPSTCAVFV